MTQRFKNAIDKLVKAYFQGTLESGACEKCAVGNICGFGQWYDTLSKIREDRELDVRDTSVIEYAEETSGYSIHEINEIEEVFEKNNMRDTEEEQYKALCAVFEKLCELDGITDSEPYKKMLEMA